MIETDKRIFSKSIKFEKSGKEISVEISLININEKQKVFDFLDYMFKEIKESI